MDSLRKKLDQHLFVYNPLETLYRVDVLKLAIRRKKWCMVVLLFWAMLETLYLPFQRRAYLPP